MVAVSAAAIVAAAELQKLDGGESVEERLTFSPIPDDAPMSDISPVGSTVLSSGHLASSPEHQRSPTPDPVKDFVTETIVPVVEKTKSRSVNEHQAAQLDKWLRTHNNNLYPCREDKEALAQEMQMTYLQVNRWFANRRRKQTKRSKVVTSPAVGPSPSQVASQNSRAASPATNLENSQQLLNAFAQVIAQQQREAAAAAAVAAKQEETQEEKPQKIMVATSRERADTPPALDGSTLPSIFQNGFNTMDAKLLATLAAVAQQSSGFTNPALQNQLLISLLQNYPPQIVMPIVQSVLISQEQQRALVELQARQLALAAHHAQQQQHVSPAPVTAPVAATAPPATAAAAAQWLSPPPSNADSASPPRGNYEESTSSLSELSELSPRPSSPPFKDPQQLADPAFLRLLNRSALTESENVAIAVLTDFSEFHNRAVMAAQYR